jgi:hypothetical protein
MHFAQTKNGVFNVVKNLGAIDPRERTLDEKEADRAVTD